MVAADTPIDELLSFTIENNVIKGKTKPYTSHYKSAGALLFDILKETPSIISQVDGPTGIEDSYEDMLDRSIKCALWLKKQGIGKGDIVATSTDVHRECLIPCLASLFIGAIFNAWDSDMNVHLARHFITTSEPKVLFANEESVRVALEAAKIEVFPVKVVTYGKYAGTTPFSEVLKGHDKSDVADFQCTEIDNSQDIAYILYSSGTTGLPKGVMTSHHSLLGVLQMTDLMNMSSSSLMWFSPIYWVSGLLLSLLSISTRRKRIITPNYQDKIACELIEKYKIGWTMLSTSMANRFVRYSGLHDYDLSSLKVLFVGGASLKKESQDLLKKHLPQTMIIQAYGMTEMGGLITTQVSGSSTSGSCGIVNVNCQLKIVDIDTGKTLGPNETGEICGKSVHMMTGYFKNPEATANTIDKEGWLHSGDIGYFNEKGELFIVDRVKELIKYLGYQVTPTEIENLLQSHPGVLEAAVVGIPHPTEDEHPIAFVSKVPNMEVTAEELIKKVATTLTDHFHLRGGVQFLPSLPHTPSGKVSRKELKAIARSMATT
ncbi:uncharacterized protein LOC128872835 [Hylaeus volcanicus]|uniref:uncharacterized protein LOC128872835 n=1 Tax=Hylaeus volcanicus TaxID=313075 RepID=UPI0023B7FA16|nr:uncharacterized protein LOC128872835 [Hylaeus volcanicus]